MGFGHNPEQGQPCLDRIFDRQLCVGDTQRDQIHGAFGQCLSDGIDPYSCQGQTDVLQSAWQALQTAP